MQNCHHSLHKQLVGMKHVAVVISCLIMVWIRNPLLHNANNKQVLASLFYISGFSKTFVNIHRLTRRVYRNLTVLLLWTVWNMEVRVMRPSVLHSWAEGKYRFKFRKVGRESGMLPLSPYVALHKHKYTQSYQQLAFGKQVTFGKWKRSQSLGNICFGWI